MPDQKKQKLYEELALSVELGRPKDTERLLEAAVAEGETAKSLVQKGLIPGMRKVGADFQDEEADIPRLLCAARAMQKGIDVLQPYLEEGEDIHIGKAIIGTVEGDLHEVGKNLVVIMFRSVGFDVIDLGVDVSDRQFAKAVQDHPDAGILCVSSLLTTTMPAVRDVVRKIRIIDRAGRVRIMIGGGSVTEAFAKEVGADAYTENAVDAAELARAFVFGNEEEVMNRITGKTMMNKKKRPGDTE